jgi:hypothetical protein
LESTIFQDGQTERIRLFVRDVLASLFDVPADFNIEYIAREIRILSIHHD